MNKHFYAAWNTKYYAKYDFILEMVIHKSNVGLCWHQENKCTASDRSQSLTFAQFQLLVKTFNKNC